MRGSPTVEIVMVVEEGRKEQMLKLLQKKMEFLAARPFW